MKKSNKVALVVANVAKKMASMGCNAASMWALHQPKEPQTPKK